MKINSAVRYHPNLWPSLLGDPDTSKQDHTDQYWPLLFAAVVFCVGRKGIWPHSSCQLSPPTDHILGRHEMS